MKFYTITVEVEDRFAPSLRAMTDTVADLLEAQGARPVDYQVETNGPPELTIGYRFR